MTLQAVHHKSAFYRNEFRKKQIETYKQNMRNLLVFNNIKMHYQSHKCYLCIDDQWLESEKLVNIKYILVETFKSEHICDKHVESFTSKTLQMLITQPNLYSQLFKTTPLITKNQLLRIIFIYDEIANNSLLQNNLKFWNQVNLYFSHPQLFMYQILCCAFGYSQFIICSKQQIEMKQDSWRYQIKQFCIHTAFTYLEKYPYLFNLCADEFPLDYFIHQFVGDRKIIYYEVLLNAFEICLINVELNKQIICHLEDCFRNIVGQKYSSFICDQEIELIFTWIIKLIYSKRAISHEIIETIIKFISYKKEKRKNLSFQILYQIKRKYAEFMNQTLEIQLDYQLQTFNP